MGTITVSDLGKAYRQYASRWGRLAEWLLPGGRPRHTLKWVLQDLSFSVAPGEAVGIIGINGAGKSTLLKMIAGTAQPTQGSVRISGRVAALLELGMGFHPDFSGRQNVVMAGQLLGYGAPEIDRLMPEVEAFAEIGDYIDQPVRVYSSGMQMRLAFSVATACRPDVLIVDEALSVGDAYFQHKSFDRIRRFRAEGTTLLIVSHDRAAIQSVCDRAILLDSGRLAMEGQPEEVMDFYNALLAQRHQGSIVQSRTGDGRLQTVSGTGEASIETVELLDAEDRAVSEIGVGAQVTLRITVRARAAVPRLVLGYLIKDRLGQEIFGINTHHLARPLCDVSAGESAEFRFTFPANLGEGSYSLAVALTSSDTHLGDNYEWRDLALVFRVVNTSRPVFAGCAWIEPALAVRRLPVQ